ncbi:hypothetical protein BDV41DRAFT_551877 [Aspergillus transmontanensis]|uniref:Uncharacterized protein n=1 Tax=Aspergillus transmontanensis TaxID=1034304 RepID=A0A5N6VIJ9_9EURO|nr:hypothetical protein BDV41DRAFT_551877 [Aspergillus transmontanensis]
MATNELHTNYVGYYPLFVWLQNERVQIPNYCKLTINSSLSPASSLVDADPLPGL